MYIANIRHLGVDICLIKKSYWYQISSLCQKFISIRYIFGEISQADTGWETSKVSSGACSRIIVHIKKTVLQIYVTSLHVLIVWISSKH